MTAESPQKVRNMDVDLAIDRQSEPTDQNLKSSLPKDTIKTQKSNEQGTVRISKKSRRKSSSNCLTVSLVPKNLDLQIEKELKDKAIIEEELALLKAKNRIPVKGKPSKFLVLSKL